MSRIPAENSPLVVQNTPGYNSWSFVQALGNTLVCAYSRGKEHRIEERCRGVYARTSTDGGMTWTTETLVVNTPEFGECATGTGLDADGSLLLWVRCTGEASRHDLYRSGDGIKFTRIASLHLDPVPMQIMNIFSVPGVGLMTFWFAGKYRDLAENSWGTLTSRDNGMSWQQQVVESGLPKGAWPTEQSGVYLSHGRILAIARVEKNAGTVEPCQFQLESSDYGVTWQKMQTNIGDVRESTPSLIWNAESGLLSNYYYQRNQGWLKRRVAALDTVWGKPRQWPLPEMVAAASTNDYHAGNVDAIAWDGKHFCTFYSGNETQTDVLLVAASAPTECRSAGA